jgi:hypothetical protein
MTLCFVYAFLQENFVAPSWYPDRLRGVKILDTNNSLTLLVALLSLIAVRQQFIATLTPYLTYSSEEAIKQVDGKSETWWQVHVRNVGSGIASIQSVLYHVAVSSDTVNFSTPPMNLHAQVVEKIKNKGLEEGKDYSLLRFSHGAIIGPNESIMVFEAPLEKARLLTMLDMRIRFESRSGEVYEKDVYCIRADWLPQQESVPPAAPSPPPGNQGNTENASTATQNRQPLEGVPQEPRKQ